MVDVRTYDAIVVGAGPAGENAAAYAAEHGLTVAIIEDGLVGGECSYWACMPSKALLRPTELLAAARRLPGASAAVTGTVDAASVLASRDQAASNWDDTGQVTWLEEAGIELVRGRGRLAGEKRVEVDHADGSISTLEARRGVVLATGTSAVVPPVEGLDAVGAWDNHDVTELQGVPRRLLILGGGVVGLEMAQAIRRLGAEEVIVAEASEHLLPREEPFVGEELARALAAEGVELRMGVRASRVSRPGAGPVTMLLDDGSVAEGDELLVAVGRQARTSGVGLETVGVTPDTGGYLPVDDALRVAGIDWLYAVGDVNGRVLLTHHGKYQGRLVGAKLAGAPSAAAWADDRAAVRVIFTDPQVAAVGLTSGVARERGIVTRVVHHDFAATAGASLSGLTTPSTAQLVLDGHRNVIIGATLVGAGAGELIHAATIAIVGEVPLERLWHAVPAFPTLSEVWLRLLEQARSEARIAA